MTYSWKASFAVARRVGLAIEAADIGFVVTEKQFRPALAVEFVASELRMLRSNRGWHGPLARPARRLAGRIGGESTKPGMPSAHRTIFSRSVRRVAERCGRVARATQIHSWFRRAILPRPGVTEPQLWEQMDRRRLRPAVADGDKHQNVVRRGLGVFDEDVEIAVVVENAGVEQFELRLVFATTPVLLDQPSIGEFPLRILVEQLQVGVRWRGVEVIVELLHVLAVIAFGVGKSEQALLENRVFAVP